MKRFLTIITFSLILLTILSACSNTVDNNITFTNFATNKVIVNFRASLIPVEAGKTVIVSDIERGTYLYETTYEVPASATSFSANGAVAGEVKLEAGTKILIVYSSTNVDSAYTLYATISTSEGTAGNLLNP